MPLLSIHCPGVSPPPIAAAAMMQPHQCNATAVRFQALCPAVTQHQHSRTMLICCLPAAPFYMRSGTSRLSSLLTMIQPLLLFTALRLQTLRAAFFPGDFSLIAVWLVLLKSGSRATELSPRHGSSFDGSSRRCHELSIICCRRRGWLLGHEAVAFAPLQLLFTLQ